MFNALKHLFLKDECLVSCVFWGKMSTCFLRILGKMSACFLRIFGKMCALFPACFVHRVLRAAGAVPGFAPLLPLAAIKPRPDFIRIMPVFTRIPAVLSLSQCPSGLSVSRLQNIHLQKTPKSWICFEKYRLNLIILGIIVYYCEYY